MIAVQTAETGAKVAEIKKAWDMDGSAKMRDAISLIMSGQAK